MIVRKVLGDIPLTRDLKLLLIIGGLYSISAALSNTFVNIFLWKQSGSFFEIGLYNITIVIFQPLTFILAGKMAKVIDRVIVLRIGVICLAAFYLVVLMVGDAASKYILLLGAILGIGYGFYWLAYNVLTFEITEPENRDFFNGFLGIMSSLGGMLGPFLAGYIITHTFKNIGYSIIFGISMLLFAIAVVLSFFIKRRHAHGKYYFWRIIQERKNNRNWNKILLAHICQGWREGTFTFIVSVFIFISTGSELSLGTFGLINSGIGLFTYYAASRFIKKENRNKAILLGGLGLFVSIFLLIFKVTYFNLLLYGALIAVFYPLLLVPYVSLSYDVIGTSWKAAEMRVEYIVVRDLYLNIGRVLSILLFLISISFFNMKQIIPYLLFILGAGHLFIYFLVKDIEMGVKRQK
ncbi:MFS transporter [Bacillus massiliigorillae]|uniref:MFS transporter n=1 Tax=Bacillus massiliigorillae TaxID=1243664 RepID=UPI0003AA259C|nr:MFS transporter [Bacillus massiliigorillae]